MQHFFAKLFGCVLLSLIAYPIQSHDAQKEPSQALPLPQIVQTESGAYTIPPQVMTYAELAQLLSTPSRQVEAHPSLRQKGILVALNSRSWNELVKLLEYGLEVQFVKLEEAEGVERWQIIRHPEAEKRDSQLFNRYVQVVHKHITEQVRQFEGWFGRPREQIKTETKQLKLPFLESLSSDEEIPFLERTISAEDHDGLVRWFHALWTQSLDGYVMLQWMRHNWNEARTRQLIRKRMVLVQQPLVQGFPGIITEKDLLDFLKRVGEEELPAYDWTIGVVSWNPDLRLVVPYCDIVAPHAEGTQWMGLPVILRAEPLSQTELWRQLGEEAQAYRSELIARQKSLAQEPTLDKPFRVEDAVSLSEMLEGWAKTHQRELLMELAPERERYWHANTANLTLRGLVQPDLSGWLSEDTAISSALTMAIITHYLDSTVVGKSHKEVIYKGLETNIPQWYYELHENVLIVRNPMGFLDRQYTYPLDALFAFERVLPQARGDLERLLEVLSTFAWGVIRQPEHAPALAGYRRGAWLGERFKMLPALAVMATLSRSERQATLKRLEQKREVEIPLQRMGVERLDAITKFWRRNAPYAPEIQPLLEPFGFRNAWHPRFGVHLRRGSIVLNSDEDYSYISFDLQIGVQSPNGFTTSRTRSLGTLYRPQAPTVPAE